MMASENRKSFLAGRSKGISQFWAGVIAVVGVALGAHFGFKQYLKQKYQVHHDETSNSSNF
jgi:hypothetical protein